MKDIYTLEDINYIELQTINYNLYRVDNNIIREFSLKLKYDKVDTSVCKKEYIEDILLVDNMLLITEIASIYSIDDPNSDYEEDENPISQIEIYLKNGTVLSAYVDMTSIVKNSNQTVEVFSNNGEDLLLISIEDK